MQRILIIDDDAILTMLLGSILKKSGYDVVSAPNGSTGLNYAGSKNPDLIITDYQMPDLSGLEVLAELKKKLPDIPVIMLTAHGDVSLTIKAIQSGAFDFIEKPINPKEILEAIDNGLKASERSKTLAEAIAPGTRKSLEENLLVGKNPVMRDIFKNIGRVSMNKVNVVITGEPGTGKERVARLIHYSGISRDHPFIVVNCNAINEADLDRELFGGPDARLKSGTRDGKLLKAGFGTIFLNDMSLLSLQLQARLLELIDGKGRHADGDLHAFNARIIASASHDVEAMVAAGTFINDLYYKLKVFSFHIPPLRERSDDMTDLVNHLLQQLNRAHGKKINKVENGVIPLLQSYQWPGNVRELKNILMQAMVLSHGDVLEIKHVIIPHQETQAVFPDNGLIASLADVEKVHILKILTHTGWNKQEAANLLGITRPTLNAKIEKYKLM